MTCRVSFCDRDPKSLGLCDGHYKQQRRGKEFSPLRPPNVPIASPICQIEGCEKPRKGRYCSMHHGRIDRNGDPHTFIPPRDRAMRRGVDHPGWQEIPSYTAIHQRLRKARGRARTYVCPCGKPASQWAYTGPRTAGVRLPAEANLNNYVAMCVPCHKRMDLARIAEAERGAA